MDWSAYKDVAPRPAAAGIVLHGEPARVLLAERNRKLAFMGGHHVFPGGSVDQDDTAALVDHAPNPEEARCVFAVVREIFEETGLLLVAPRPPLEALRAARRALLGAETKFSAILETWGLRLDARHFLPAGVWVTPPFSPIRFNTRFYTYSLDEAPYEEVLRAEDEIVALDWLTPAEARQRWHAGQLRLSTPVAFVLRRLAVFPLPEALPWLRQTPPEGGIHPHLFEPRRGVHILPLRAATLPPATHTNCIILGEEDLYVIDPGASEAEEQDRLVTEIDHLCALGGAVSAILLTHSHPDHVAAAPLLRARYGAPIWAHRATAHQLEFAVDRALEDEEVIEVPGNPCWRLRCLHTPGHDPGHLCFLEETTRTLLCGDLAANPGAILIAPEYGGDMTAYLASLERVRLLPFNFMVPAHGLPLWGAAAQEKLDELHMHRLEREAKIRAALESGVRTEEEILAQAYADTPRDAWPLAAMQLRAHLARLDIHWPAVEP
ncbi:MAG: MBL fold metallo-hydrolase [Candidatus Hydrogenedentes bacterium]|nr:MBL fold metallo-hydrolase [Candidatus Hydrogenedentota bacterium]